MFWTRNRQGEDAVRLMELEARVNVLESALRTLENEQISMHSQVKTYMRRERALERHASRSPDEQPERATPTLRTWGARDRIARRQANGHDSPPAKPAEE